MDLSKFGVKNLRCFSDPVKIDIKPINILVGKNSSGKSTIARLFPLMRQSLETKTIGPILWYGQYVDFGSFGTAISKESDENSIQFNFEFELKPEKHPSRFRSMYLKRTRSKVNIYEEATVSICVKLEFNSDTNESYTSEFSIDIFNNQIKVNFDQDRLVSNITINGNTVRIPDNQFGFGLTSDFLPEINFLRFKKTKDSEGETHETYEYSDFFTDTKLINFIKQYSHGGLSRKRIRPFIRLLGIASDEFLIKKANFFQSSSVNLNNFARSLKNNPTHFSMLKEFYLLHVTNSITELLNSTIKRNFANVKYIKPVRATAQRYYRYQELSIEEIDAEGANVAMFLESLRFNDKQNLNEWLEAKIGIRVEPRREGGHIALFVREVGSNSSQNIADMGFGYSQVLPILVQAWTSKNEGDSRPDLTMSSQTSALVIEQPELHLHPEFQAKLSNVICELAILSKQRDNPFPIIIETHSPQIVNRFGELVEEKELDPEDIVIYLFEETEGRNSIRRANYNQEGTLENWPFGFFEAED